MTRSESPPLFARWRKRAAVKLNMQLGQAVCNESEGSFIPTQPAVAPFDFHVIELFAEASQRLDRMPVDGETRKGHDSVTIALGHHLAVHQLHAGIFVRSSEGLQAQQCERW